MTPRVVRALVAVFLVFSLGACSSSDDDGASSTTTTEPRSTTSTTAVVGDGEEWIAFQGVPQGISLIRADGSGSRVILGPPGEQLPVPEPEAERATCPACGLKLGRVDGVWVPDEGARPE